MIAEAATNFVFSSGWRCRRGRVFDSLRADFPHAALTLARSERTPAVSPISVRPHRSGCGFSKPSPGGLIWDFDRLRTWPPSSRCEKMSTRGGYRKSAPKVVQQSIKDALANARHLCSANCQRLPIYGLIQLAPANSLHVGAMRSSHRHRRVGSRSNHSHMDAEHRTETSGVTTRRISNRISRPFA
jgi:hypothetical protein